MDRLSEETARTIVSRHLRDPASWQISEALGSMGTTRMARRKGRALAIKLTVTPPSIIERLAQLQVTPSLFATGEHDGRPYFIQHGAIGPHADPAWFSANLSRWASRTWGYLHDPLLRELVQTEVPRPFTLSDALVEPDKITAPRGAALRESSFVAACERWQEQSGQVPELPPGPIHPDAHMRNYVIDDGRPYLLDWDGIQLADPMRDAGIQIWGFLPRPQWAEFLRYGGLELSPDLETSVYWWSAFKMLTNAVWCDSQLNEEGAKFHAAAFVHAVSRQPWQR